MVPHNIIALLSRFSQLISWYIFEIFPWITVHRRVLGGPLHKDTANQSRASPVAFRQEERNAMWVGIPYTAPQSIIDKTVTLPEVTYRSALSEERQSAASQVSETSQRNVYHGRGN